MKRVENSILATVVLVLYLFALVNPVKTVQAEAVQASGSYSLYLPVVYKPISVPETVNLKTLTTWNVLFLVYQSIDVNYTDGSGVQKQFQMTIPKDEFTHAITSIYDFPSLSYNLSENNVYTRFDTIIINTPIQRLSPIGSLGYWLSPEDIKEDINTFAPVGRYDSIIAYWPGRNFQTGEGVANGYWGLGMMKNSASNGATFASIANAAIYWWGNPPRAGQVFLHEWLHGVCPFYSDKGFRMPSGDADGGGMHGYSDDPKTGYSMYYHDLMTGKVGDSGVLTGITPAAWQSGSITGKQETFFADYFFNDTTNRYATSGFVKWDDTNQSVVLGDQESGHINRLYKGVSISQSVELSARIFIQENIMFSPDNIGPNDTVAFVAQNANSVYKIQLAYGLERDDKDSVSIFINEKKEGSILMPLTPGWYNVQVYFDQPNQKLMVRVWTDGENVPNWQLSTGVAPGWKPNLVGFEHQGNRVTVDDLNRQSRTIMHKTK